MQREPRRLLLAAKAATPRALRAKALVKVQRAVLKALAKPRFARHSGAKHLERATSSAPNVIAKALNLEAKSSTRTVL